MAKIIDENGLVRLLDIKTIEGLETTISDIPTIVVNDHHEVYPYWEKSGLKNTVLMHIDAHPDMNYVKIVPDLSKKGEPIYKIGIGNFITYAFFSEIVSSIYWYDPHVENREGVLFVGARDKSYKSNIAPLISRIHGEYLQLIDPKDIRRHVYLGDGNRINSNSVIEGELILDIDLDAFCCHKNTQNPRIKYNSVHNWENRIEKMIKILSEIQRPKMITIARSSFEIDNLSKSFVPHKYVDKVQEDTINALNKLYK